MGDEKPTSFNSYLEQMLIEFAEMIGICVQGHMI